MSSSSFAVTELIPSEGYPTTVRSTAIGIGSAIARLEGFATSFLAEGLFLFSEWPQDSSAF